MCEFAKYSPVGYAYAADNYCLQCTAFMGLVILAENVRLRNLFPQGKKVVRDDSQHVTLFLRGNRIIAKRYDKRGRCTSKQVVSYNASSLTADCEGVDCVLDAWAAIKGVVRRHADSYEFPAPVLHHDACQIAHEDVDCADPDECEGHHEICGTPGCGADICD